MIGGQLSSGSGRRTRQVIGGTRRRLPQLAVVIRCHVGVLAAASASAKRRWSGLDGLRALAVTAVVMFHFAPNVVPGGFLGVDIFFVLSGYLITRMIVTEYLRFGGLRFRNFYLRRARRLLPGLALVLLCVLAAAAFWRDQLTTVRQASAAAAAYVSNWWLSFAHQSYFVTAGRPSMLQHLWSLAVEEQFYLVWPLIAVVALSLAPRRGRTVALAAVAVLLALASAAEMAALAIAHNAPYSSDASRLYYGTDTHSMGLLLGATLGALAAGRSVAAARRPTAPRRWIALTDGLAAGAVVALTAIVVGVHESSPGLYRGGFLAVAATAAVATGCVARTGSRVGAALDAKPLRWLAARSYSIYLWHWPVAVVTRPGVDVFWPGPVVLFVRVTVTLLLADITHRCVELPVRSAGFRASVRAGLQRVARVVVGRAPVGARLVTAALVALALVGWGVLFAGPRPVLSPVQKVLAAEHGGRDLPVGPQQHADPSRRAGHAPPTARAPADPRPVAVRTRPNGPKTSPVAHAHPLPAISAYGDSVMLGARAALNRRFPGGTLDAVEGRQPDPILHDVEQDAAAGRLKPLVVIGVGDNGLIDPATLRQTLARLRHVHRVIVINNRVDRMWEGPNNRTIARAVPHYRNAILLDWHALAASHPSWFYDDGIHLTTAGAGAYTGLIAAAARGHGSGM